MLLLCSSGQLETIGRPLLVVVAPAAAQNGPIHGLHSDIGLALSPHSYQDKAVRSPAQPDWHNKSDSVFPRQVVLVQLGIEKSDLCLIGKQSRKYILARFRR